MAAGEIHSACAKRVQRTRALRRLGCVVYGLAPWPPPGTSPTVGEGPAHRGSAREARGQPHMLLNRGR